MRKTLVRITIVTVFLAAAPAVLAEDDCNATASATLDHQEDAELQFRVEVSTEEPCAHIDYDLVLDVQLPDGDTTQVKKARLVKLDDGSLTEIVKHTLGAGESMLSHEAQVTKCRTCVLEK